MLRLAIPILRVDSIETAEKFYRESLGFERHFAYRVDETKSDPCYMGFRKDGVWIHVSSFFGDGVAGAAAYVIVDDVDEVHRALVKNGLSINLEPTDQTWGNREMYVDDPGGNTIRFVQERQG